MVKAEQLAELARLVSGIATTGFPVRPTAAPEARGSVARLTATPLGSIRSWVSIAGPPLDPGHDYICGLL